MASSSEDGRTLLVEVLHNVYGLDKADMQAVETVMYRNVEYRLLDPIAMLKAKAANVRDLDQTERHDRDHWQLVAKCVPRYLADVHKVGMVNPSSEKDVLAVVSRTFKTLQHPKIAETLRVEGISISALIPSELAHSPLERIQRAYAHQVKLLRAEQKRRGPRISL